MGIQKWLVHFMENPMKNRMINFLGYPVMTKRKPPNVPVKSMNYREKCPLAVPLTRMNSSGWETLAPWLPH